LYSRDQFEGTGIGLAIAKKIVEKHNGLITAKSNPGDGSTFIIILPLKRQANGIQHSTEKALTKAD
jgi:signal transduction histidine kinase